MRGGRFKALCAAFLVIAGAAFVFGGWAALALAIGFFAIDEAIRAGLLGYEPDRDGRISVFREGAGIAVRVTNDIEPGVEETVTAYLRPAGALRIAEELTALAAE